ncbi:MAG: marine proteobacterial sortase target protein [Acidobacteriota bacterium]
MQKVVLPILFCVLFSLAAYGQKITQGELDAVGKDGKPLGSCPLKNTSVKAEISGFLTRVKVSQEFENNFSEKIEAVYVFPLSDKAAVDDMTMHIGDRVVRGKIMKREEAREVYEAARSNGQIASLLDQERPNIFTQSVANILPGEKVTIEISYVETLKYEDGAYEFVFPMVVAPRYIPGQATGKSGGGFASDSDKVPDGSKITPPISKDRAGHDISIEVKLDAGVPVQSVTSQTHEIDSIMQSVNSYTVKLKNANAIPNKDFILRYDVAGKRIDDAVLTHRDEKGGYFTLILQPPDIPRAEDITPKEIVFVLDTSGSMDGFPIEKAKEAMKMSLDGLNPQDTFNLITFAGDTSVLFEKPVPATPENRKKAQAFLATREGGGGTEMMKAIKTALDPSDAQDHIRIVCFMTDGEIGNDAEIIAEIQKHPNARVFSFGIGSSVNRFLLDKMAEEGRGEVEYVGLNDDGSAAARRFKERVQSPLLTDISLDFGDLKVADVYPKRINDLFSAKPVIIHGRYTQPGSGTIKLMGKTAGNPVSRDIKVNFPEANADHDVLATLWARTRIDDLTSQDYSNSKPEIKDAITNIGLEYGLLTQFTSFVAVEERVVTDGGQPRRIEVPVELPEGMKFESVFGQEETEKIPSPMDQSVSDGPVRTNGSGTGRAINRPIAGKDESKSKRRPDKVYRRNDTGYIITGEKKQEYAVDIKASELPKPEYPLNSRSAGSVDVEVTLDATGKVIAAKAVSGTKAFQAAAVSAARNAGFPVPRIPYEITKITGVVTYNFAVNKKVSSSGSLSNIRIDTKPNKYSVAVRAVVDRLKVNGSQLSADEAKFVRNGKADLVIRLKEVNPAVVEQLKSLGVDVLAEMPSSNAVIGRISLDKIAALADIDSVVFISPQDR